jgi:hypothetical protein
VVQVADIDCFESAGHVLPDFVVCSLVVTDEMAVDNCSALPSIQNWQFGITGGNRLNLEELMSSSALGPSGIA